MNTSQLKLNDFEGFNRAIFRGRDPKWESLYNQVSDTFYPPIPYPKSEVEHQLDHYALWMTMAHYGLISKPKNFKRRSFLVPYALEPHNYCYACEWQILVYHTPVNYCGAKPCPLASSGRGFACGPDWANWVHLTTYSSGCLYEIREAANAVAHIEWREIS